MNNIKTVTAYILVDVKEGDDYYHFNPMVKYDNLEKHESVYVFTAEELEQRDRERDQRVAGEAFEAGQQYEFEQFGLKQELRISPSKEQYLNNLK